VLHGGVKVHCKSLFLLYKTKNTVYTIGYTVLFNLKGLHWEIDPLDEVHGWTFWILKKKSQKSDRAVRWLTAGRMVANDRSYGAVRALVIHQTENFSTDFKDLQYLFEPLDEVERGIV